jgi:hypothetical protein
LLHFISLLIVSTLRPPLGPPLEVTTSLAPKKLLFAAFVFATKNSINDMRYSHFFTLLIYYYIPIVFSFHPIFSFEERSFIATDGTATRIAAGLHCPVACIVPHSQPV